MICLTPLKMLKVLGLQSRRENPAATVTERLILIECESNFLLSKLN